MHQQQRPRDPRPQPDRPAEGTASSPQDDANTDRLRASSGRLFQRADEIDALIKANLSLDSTKMLRATRQASGQ